MNFEHACEITNARTGSAGQKYAVCPKCNDSKETLVIFDVGDGMANYLCTNSCEPDEIDAAIQKKIGFEFISVADLMAEDISPNWRVRGWLPNYGLSLLFGDSESGKTFIALDWALHIAAGLPWHGIEVKQGPVFYIVGEGRSGLRWRITAWCQYYGVKPESLPFYISRVSAQLYDQIGALEVATTVDRMSKGNDRPAMIVVDTLARNFGPGNENDNADMGKFIDYLDEFFVKPFQTLLLTVHHPGHGDKGRARGAYSLHCAMDAEFQVERDDDLVTLSCTKMKDHEHPPSLVFKSKIIEMLEADEYSVPRSSLIFERMEHKAPVREKKLGKIQKQALKVLRDMYNEARYNLETDGRDPATAKVELMAWRTRLELEENNGKPLLGRYPRQRWHEIRDSLIEKKILITDQVHVFLDY